MKIPCAQPPVGLFTMSPEALAESLASRAISPQGPASGLRLLTFYLSHSAKRLSPSRLRSLEKAKKLLAALLEQEIKDRELRARKVA